MLIGTLKLLKSSALQKIHEILTENSRNVHWTFSSATHLAMSLTMNCQVRVEPSAFCEKLFEIVLAIYKAVKRFDSSNERWRTQTVQSVHSLKLSRKRPNKWRRPHAKPSRSIRANKIINYLSNFQKRPSESARVDWLQRTRVNREREEAAGFSKVEVLKRKSFSPLLIITSSNVN